MPKATLKLAVKQTPDDNDLDCVAVAAVERLKQRIAAGEQIQGLAFNAPPGFRMEVYTNDGRYIALGYFGPAAVGINFSDAEDGLNYEWELHTNKRVTVLTGSSGHDLLKTCECEVIPTPGADPAGAKAAAKRADEMLAIVTAKITAELPTH